MGHKATHEAGESDALSPADIGAATSGHDHDADYQPLNSNLTAIAALTTTAYGRGFLDDADADAAQTTLGISAFVKTILDDADAAAVRTTIGAVGVPLAQSDVTGLVAALAAKMDDGEAAGGVLTGTYPNPGLAASVAGAGLDNTAGVLSINTGVHTELVSDILRIKAAALGDGLTGGGASVLSVNAGAGLEFSSGALRIAAALAGNGLTGGAGSALAVDPGDGLQIVSDEVAVASDVARKNVNNSFATHQDVTGNLGVTGTATVDGLVIADSDGSANKVFMGAGTLTFGAGFGDAAITRNAANILTTGRLKITAAAAADEALRRDQVLDLVDAKGDLLAASAADTLVRRAVGSDGDVLKADSGQASGLNWGSPFHTVIAQASDLAVAGTGMNNTDLIFTFVANSRYVIDLYLLMTSAAATTGYGFAFDTSVAVDIVALNFFHALAATGTVSGGDSIADDTARALSSGVQSTTLNPIMGMAIIDTGANGGTARLRVRSEVAAASVFKAGSTMRVLKTA